MDKQQGLTIAQGTIFNIWRQVIKEHEQAYRYMSESLCSTEEMDTLQIYTSINLKKLNILSNKL